MCFCSTIYVSYMNVRPNCFYWSVCQPTKSQLFPDGFSRLHEKMCVCVHLMIGNPKIWIKSKLSNSEKVSIHWHWKDCAKQKKTQPLFNLIHWLMCLRLCRFQVKNNKLAFKRLTICKHKIPTHKIAQLYEAVYIS